MSLQPGTRLGNYEVLSELGRGGMGEVYKARDLKLGRDVAIKVLPEEMAADAQRLRRFEQEARAASALNHPNIVTIYEIGEHEGIPYIVMEYVDGISLRDMLADGPLPNDELIRYAAQMAEGLAKAHEAGIVHRDLKPENIVVSADGFVKILDFGLAKLLPLDGVGSEVATMEQQRTTPGAILGTVSYMSPEQARGEPTDFRSDQFSLGAVLYEMATGERAFGRKSAADSLAAVLKDEPRAEGPLALVVERCLKKRASERWASTEELVSALRQPVSPQPSIAVLPFSNMSADPEQEYFCEGIAEDIINALTRVRNLSVVARTSAFAFKGQNIDLREVGQKLNVSHVLEGSVRKAGKRLRITAQLIKVSDGYHLWSERFDRELDDIFAIQDEISLAIVEQLRVKLVEDEREALVKRPTESPELHNLYLLGRYHFNRFTIEDTRRSQEYLEKAIQLEPSYAPAYAMLAIVHLQYSSGGLNVVPPRDTVPKAKAAAERALELDPANSDAHATLACIGVFHERDWPKVLEHSRKALELDPSAAMAHAIHAYYLSISRRFDEAIAEIEKAIVLDPLAPMMTENAAWHAYHARDLERARTYCQKAFELAPDFAWAHYIVGLIEVQAGRLEQAKSAFERGRGTGFMNGYIGYAMAAMGDHEGAQALLEEVERDVASGNDSSYSKALVHFGRGDTERCLDALEEMTEEAPAILVVSAWLNVDPFWDPLRDDPRFHDLLRRMNFP